MPLWSIRSSDFLKSIRRILRRLDSSPLQIGLSFCLICLAIFFICWLAIFWNVDKSFSSGGLVYNFDDEEIRRYGHIPQTDWQPRKPSQDDLHVILQHRHEKDVKRNHSRHIPDIPYLLPSNSVVGMALKVEVLRAKRSDAVEFECMEMKILPPAPVCLYNDNEDIFISKILREKGIWEEHIVTHFLQVVDTLRGNVTVLDVGANIGVYSMSSAIRNISTIAVEPFSENLRRLRHAGSLNTAIEQNLLIVPNVLSSEHVTVNIGPEDSSNKGGVAIQGVEFSNYCPTSCETVQSVTFNDLIPLINTSHVVIKIDIEGHEYIAFQMFQKFFDTFKVPYIFMEWFKLRSYYGAKSTNTKEKRLTHAMVRYLSAIGYVPFSSISGRHLNSMDWYGWPDDIFWQLVRRPHAKPQEL